MAGGLAIELIKKGFVLACLFLVFIIFVRIMISTISPEYLASIFGTSNTGYNVLVLAAMAFGLLIVAFILIRRIFER
ncbi:MAG: hypothetical protein NTZ39_07295 [Methanoregula sp.]|nr:hypothetical protein [Methanoregula sp.]